MHNQILGSIERTELSDEIFSSFGRPEIMCIFKVTTTTIGETKRGYKVFKLQLNNSIWATKLFPLRKSDREYDKLYQRYLEHENISFLEGKYISVSISQSEYGYQFSLRGCPR